MVKLTDYDDPRSFGSRIRARRIVHLSKLIDAAHSLNGSVRVLDIGGRENYWKLLPREFLESRGVHVTVVNLPSDLRTSNDAMFTHIAADACDLHIFGDHSFDIAHSNSVIEHVGSWENMKRFAREANRLAPFIYMQTPYYWFPVEPHFIKPFHHWLPYPLRVSVSMKFQMGNHRKARNLDEAMEMVQAEPVLLDRRMFRFLFPDSSMLTERFLLFPKSLIAWRGPAPQSA